MSRTFGKNGPSRSWFCLGDSELAVSSSRVLAFVIALRLFAAGPLAAQFVPTQQASAQDGEMPVFAAPDESTLIVESVKKGAALSPIAESTGAGGAKWYMVRTKGGAVGWIKAGNSAEAKSVESFFKSLPKEAIVIGPGSLPPVPKGPPAPGSVTIPVETAGSALLVPVTINHSLDAYLLLDTGATITMVSSRIAKSLALHVIGSGRAVTVGGPVSQPIARLESLRAGDAEVQNLLVSIHDFHPNPRIGGLLGLDFLGRFHVSLDATKRLLVLSPR